MITERTLKQWRKEALKINVEDYSVYDGVAHSLAKCYIECQDRILRMTQELLDLHLIRK